MSQPDQITGTTAPNATGGANVRAAIARAAQASGVDFNYLLAQARLESSLNPQARAGTSSAAGLFQFTNGTWAKTLQKHPDALAVASGAGPGDASQSSILAALNDPASRARLMALRFDPDTSAMMAAQLTGDNQAALTNALGRSPDATELYLAHFLGSEGAVRLINADPGQLAMALAPKAAMANRSVFFDASGSPRTVGQVMNLMRQRVASAMADTSMPDAGALASMAGIGPGFGAGFSGGFGAGYGPGLGGGWAGAVVGDAMASGALAGAAPAGGGDGGPIARQFAAARAQDLAAHGDNAAAPDSAAGGAEAAGSPSAATSTGSMADTLLSIFGTAGDVTGTATPDAVRAVYAQLRALGL